jgi:hypothetical protein
MLTFEYILIAGVNDTDEQARELAKIARQSRRDNRGRKSSSSPFTAACCSRLSGLWAGAAVATAFCISLPGLTQRSKKN